MSLKERTINVDIMTKEYTKLKYKQGEAGQNINIKLFKNGKQLDLIGLTVNAFFEKTNGEILEKSATINDNVATITLSKQILNIAGKIKTELYITKGEELVISFTIIIDVEESINASSAVEEKEEWDSIKDLLIKSNNLAMIDDNNVSNKTTSSSYRINSQLEDIKNDFNSQIKDKATKQEVDVERKRIDSFTRLTEGSTTGDAELIDARISYDGETYDTLGNSVRKQFSNINKDVKNLESMMEYVYLENGFINEKRVAASTGDLVPGAVWSATGFLNISSILDYLYVNIPRNEYHYFAFYDIDKNYISGVTSNNVADIIRIEIPANAKYFRGSFYTEDKDKFYVKGKTKLSSSIKTIETLNISNEHFKSYDFEVGTIDPTTGIVASAQNRIRTRKYITARTIDLNIENNFNLIVFCYDGDNYLGVWNGIKNEFSKSTEWIKKCNLLTLKEWYPNINVKIVIDSSNVEDGIYLKRTVERYSSDENIKKDNADTLDFTYFIDGENGSDDNDGSQLAPFKTITKAINENGNILYIKGGVYKEAITLKNKRRVKILPSDWLYPWAEDGLVERKKIVLDFSEDINLVNSSENGLLECSYNATTDSYIYKVFVDKTLPIVNTENVTTHGDAYNCTLWEVYDKYNKGDFRLLPVLSLQECSDTEGSFFYNGSKIYVNPKTSENDAVYKLSGSNDVGVEINTCKEVVIEDLVVKYSRGANFYLKNLDNCTFRGCEGLNASIRNGFRMLNVNGNFYGCKGNNNKADGFTIQMFGRVDFFDCEAHWNGDDGLSPHDGCFGSVNNSYFSHNLKGGVSAVNGASYDLNGVISHDNEFGFLMTSNEDSKRRQVRLVNCVAYNNGTGIVTSRGDFLSYNCKFVKNTLNKQIINTSTFTELDQLTD